MAAESTVPSSDTQKNAVSASETEGFHVSDLWPVSRKTIPKEVKQAAVQGLLGNHTLVVGQSRSGKTSAVRRIVEETLRWTDARVVILDPNADFRWLKQVTSESKLEKLDKSGQFRTAWAQIAKGIRIAAHGEDAWGIQWSKLSPREMAAFLQLAPSEQFLEYRHLDRHYAYQKKEQEKGDEATGYTLEDFTSSDYFEIAVGEELERYHLRLQELSSIDAWLRKSDAVKDLDTIFEGSYRAIVVDLSSDDEQVRMITAARTLEVLWRKGLERRKQYLTNPDDSRTLGLELSW